MVINSIAQAYEYVARHEAHFGQKPSAITGSWELRRDIERYIGERGVGLRVGNDTDELLGIPIRWVSVAQRPRRG